MPGSSQRWSRRKITLAVFASLGIFGLVATTFAAVVAPFLAGDSNGTSPSNRNEATSTAPAVIIRPLSIRPVVEALQTTPEQCLPPSPPVPSTPGEPQFACDLLKMARYQLGPVGLQLNLTSATSAQIPLTKFYAVQIVMDPSSTSAFAQYTGANVGRQLAFVRDGVVLAAPTISAPLDGASLQLSGEMTASTAETIVRMLRAGT